MSQHNGPTNAAEEVGFRESGGQGLRPEPRNPGTPGPLLRILRILFFVAVFSIGLFLFHRQVLGNVTAPPYPSDLPVHIELARLFFQHAIRLSQAGFQFLVYVPSRLLGLPLETSGVVVTALLATLIAAVLYVILRATLGRQYPDWSLLLMTVLLLVVSAVYAPFFNQYVYAGQGSPNVWHSPTAIAVKPFAFLALWLFPATVERPLKGRNLGLGALVAALLLATAWTKPSFVFVLIPAVYLLFLIQRRPDLLGRSTLVFLPTIALLCAQYGATYLAPGSSEPVMIAIKGGTQVPVYTSDRILFNFLGVWRTMTPNVLVSLVLALAFPLSMLVFRFRRNTQDRHLALSWLMVAFGVIQFAVLAEQNRFGHANFSWGYVIALQPLFVFSLVEYFRWWKLRNPADAGERRKLVTVSVVLALHLVSGAFYLIRLLLGGPFL
jgi:hypothetical protein